MSRPLTLHLKAALICGLAGLALALPLIWVPLLPAWRGWQPPQVSPRAEALLAAAMAFWTAWCVVDIPRRGLKVLVWVATLWLLGSGIWLSGLFGHPSSSLVPLAATVVAGLTGLVFSFTPAGSRRARWRSLVGGRVAPDVLRSRIDERRLEEGPRAEVLAVVEVLWPGSAGDAAAAWPGVKDVAREAAKHFEGAGGYLERCDAEGARFVFGCWGQAADSRALVDALWGWVRKAGGCGAIARGECVCGVADLPSGERWTVAGAPLRRAARMAVAARGYAARVLAEQTLAEELGEAWLSRRMAWWDFEGSRVLLQEIIGPASEAAPGAADDLRRWDRAWEAFWNGDWVGAENGFASLAREKDDAAARIFALRSASARRQGEEP